MFKYDAEKYPEPFLRDYSHSFTLEFPFNYQTSYGYPDNLGVSIGVRIEGYLHVSTFGVYHFNTTVFYFILFRVMVFIHFILKIYLLVDHQMEKFHQM